MELNEIPLASPVPTPAPHPLELSRKLLAPRQASGDICGWANADPALALSCPVGDVCGLNYPARAAFCCNSAAFPACGILTTTCLDAAEYSASCFGDCITNDAIKKCTFAGSRSCITAKVDISTFSSYVFSWACGPSGGILTIKDFVTFDNGAMSTVNNFQTATVTVTPGPTSPSPPGSTNPVVPVSPATSPTPTPVPSGGLHGGVIAGIVIGALAFIAIILCLAFALVFLAKKRRGQHQPAPLSQPPYQQQQQQQGPPMTQQHQQQPMMPGSPPPPSTTTNTTGYNPHNSMLSNPSATSTTPLTHENVAAVSQPPEISPNESASQINGPTSTLSHASPPNNNNVNNNSYPGNPNAFAPPHSPSSPNPSQGHSTLGSLPPQQSQYPIGAAAFPHHQHSTNTPSSVMSPGSAFGSMPPVHAPSVGPYGG